MAFKYIEDIGLGPFNEAVHIRTGTCIFMHVTEQSVFHPMTSRQIAFSALLFQIVIFYSFWICKNMLASSSINLHGVAPIHNKFVLIRMFNASSYQSVVLNLSN